MEKINVFFSPQNPIVLKGRIHPKVKIITLFTHPHVHLVMRNLSFRWRWIRLKHHIEVGQYCGSCVEVRKEAGEQVYSRYYPFSRSKNEQLLDSTRGHVSFLKDFPAFLLAECPRTYGGVC